MDEPPAANAAQIAYWNDKAATTWTAFQPRIDSVFAPLTELALQAAAAQPGEHVLDVGCGCGETVLALACAVGATGRVTGLDVSAPMAGRARERIIAAGLDQAAILLGDAQLAPLPPAGADLLFSRFGVMFFEDPAAAFANLRGAMRPGGRLLCLAWRALSENPWFAVPLEAGTPLLPPEPSPDLVAPDLDAPDPATPDAAAPGPFAFADPARVHQILAAAGWRDVTLSPREALLPLAPAGGLAEAVEFVTRVGPLARALAGLDPALQAKIRAAVEAALRPHETAAGIALTGAVWLITASA